MHASFSSVEIDIENNRSLYSSVKSVFLLRGTSGRVMAVSFIKVLMETEHVDSIFDSHVISMCIFTGQHCVQFSKRPWSGAARCTDHLHCKWSGVCKLRPGPGKFLR